MKVEDLKEMKAEFFKEFKNTSAQTRFQIGGAFDKLIDKSIIKKDKRETDLALKKLRNKGLVGLRNKGYTFVRLARLYKISASRARVIYLQNK